MGVPTILFICRTNAVASPMAEAWLNHAAGGLFRAFSAGIDPAAGLHARARAALRAAGLAADGLAPKPIELFALPEAPHPDLVVTLTADVLGRSVDPWQSAPRRLAWLIAEPPPGAGAAVYRRLLADIAGRIDRTFLSGPRAHAAAATFAAGPRRGTASGYPPSAPRAARRASS